MGEKRKHISDTGFGSNAANFGNRLINKDGSYNVVKTGMSWQDTFNLFHFLINTSWIKLFGIGIGYFIGVTLLFSFIYYLIGPSNLVGLDYENNVPIFLQIEFFSAYTITTVGYGNIYPVGLWTNIIASFEAFVGLLSFAILSALFYGKISKPKIKIKFSEHAVISPYKNGKAIMFRMTSSYKSIIGETRVRMLASIVDANKRRFYALKLEMDRINMFVTSWTVVHPLIENSPLYNKDLEELEEMDLELLIYIKAHDETYSQEIISYHSYKYDEIIPNAKFINIHSTDEFGNAVLDVENLGTYEKFNEDS